MIMRLKKARVVITRVRNREIHRAFLCAHRMVRAWDKEKPTTIDEPYREEFLSLINSTAPEIITKLRWLTRCQYNLQSKLDDIEYRAHEIAGWCPDCAMGYYPYYGTAPHRHNLEGAPRCTFYSTKDQWPTNFEEDEDCRGYGTWYCPKCGVPDAHA